MVLFISDSEMCHCRSGRIRSEVVLFVLGSEMHRCRERRMQKRSGSVYFGFRNVPLQIWARQKCSGLFFPDSEMAPDREGRLEVRWLSLFRIPKCHLAERGVQKRSGFVYFGFRNATWLSGVFRSAVVLFISGSEMPPG